MTANRQVNQQLRTATTSGTALTRLGAQHLPHTYSYNYIDSSNQSHAGSYSCNGLTRDDAGKPWPERPRQVSALAQLLALVGQSTVVFWACPDGHFDTVAHPHRRNTVTVEWVDGIALCTQPGCGKTSTDTKPAHQAD